MDYEIKVDRIVSNRKVNGVWCVVPSLALHILPSPHFRDYDALLRISEDKNGKIHALLKGVAEAIEQEFKGAGHVV